MADGLSVAASIIAVLGAAEGVSKALSRIRSIRKAPDELLALINEVSDLRIVLGDVQNYVVQSTQGAQTAQEHLKHLSLLVDRAKEKLLQLDELIHYHLLKPEASQNQIKVSKREWLKASTTIEKFRRSLHDIRLNIVTHMAVINSSHQSRIGIIIDEIRIISTQLHTQQHSSTTGTRQQLDEHSRLLSDILNTQTNIQGLLQLQRASNEQAQLPPRGAVPFPSRSHSLGSVVRVRAQLSQHQRFLCSSYCNCVCHILRSFQSPTTLHNAIGVLFIGYSGYPVRVFNRRTETSCISTSSFGAFFYYVFPSWFLTKALAVTIASTPLGEVKAALVIRRIVPHGAEILRLVTLGDVGCIKDLMRSGFASPNDSNSYGSTVLNVAVLTRQWKTCDLLLKAGADPYLSEFNSQSSAFVFAWNFILQGSGTAAERETVRALFPDNTNSIEDRGFSRLHKAVLGLEYSDLAQQITTYKSQINSKDSNGYTALIWAVRRDDNKAIDLLVQAGADVNSPNRFGASALHYAVKSSGLRNTRLLLAAGAAIHLTDEWGYSVLHYVPEAKNMRISVGVIECLIEAGADPNKRSSHGLTPLHISALNNNLVTAKALLEYGADINLLDNDGDSALLQSVSSNADDITQLILSRGAAYQSWWSSGHSILHLAALSGGRGTLAILRNAGLEDIDPDALSRQGQSVLQVAHARTSKPEGFIEDLQELLADIRTRNAELQKARNAKLSVEPDRWARRFLKRFQLGMIDSKARLHHLAQNLRHRLSTVSLLNFIEIATLLALCLFGLSFVQIVFGLGRVMRDLAFVWSMFGPGDGGGL